MSIQTFRRTYCSAGGNQEPMDEHRVEQREKQLLYGFVTKGYLIKRVSPEQVPDPIPTDYPTIRDFNARYKEWRIFLHTYDNKTVSSLALLESVRNEIENEILAASISEDFKYELSLSLLLSFKSVCLSNISSSSFAAGASSTDLSNVSANERDSSRRPSRIALSPASRASSVDLSNVSANNRDSSRRPSRIALSPASRASSADSSNVSVGDMDEDPFTSLYKQVEGKHPESISRISNPSIWS